MGGIQDGKISFWHAIDHQLADFEVNSKELSLMLIAEIMNSFD